MIAEVYVDETNTHDGPDFICVAGYIFMRKNAKTLSRKFGKKLKKYRLPYFHMIECVSNKGIFEHLNDTQCDKIARKLIECTKEYSEYGFAVSLHKETYQKVVPEKLMPELGSEYSFCLREVFTLVRRWIERTGYKGEVSYLFESGAEHQSEANRIITNMFNTDRIKSHYNYAAHSFVDKRKFIPLGPADMLAWLYQNQLKRQAENKQPRGDMTALLRPQDNRMHLDEEALTEMFDLLRSQKPHYFDQISS